MEHASHPKIIARLKRAQGHLRTVVAMLEGGRACTDIAQQLHAVENAIASAKRTLIHDHIDHCLHHGSEADRAVAALDELKLISKFL